MVLAQPVRRRSRLEEESTRRLSDRGWVLLIQAMTEAEAWAFLGRHKIARLACARDNQPYIVPIRLDLEGDSLYGYSTLGRKIEWMRTNPLVSVECEEFVSEQHWSSVIVSGHYEELPNTPEHQAARGIAERLFQQHPMWWEPAAVPLAEDGRRASIVFRIHIGSVTGRRAVSEGNPRNHPASPAESDQSPWLTRMWRRLGSTGQDA
jgi:uncharacterized protein